MTNKIINALEFNRDIDVNNVMKLASLQLEFKRDAISNEEHQLVAFYDRKAKVYNEIATALVNGGLMTLPQILGLPSISTLSIPMNSAIITQEIEEANELKVIKTVASNEEYKEVVRSIVKSPETKEKLQKYKDNISKIAKTLEVEGFDLFALNNEQEVKLRLKMKFERELSPNEEKRMFAKEIRQTLIELLSKGARDDAIDLLRHYTKHLSYSEYELHKLLESLKNKYSVKEPKTRPNILPLYIGNFKEQWLSIKYSFKKQQSHIEKYAKTTELGLYDPDKFDGIINVEGKVICNTKQIVRFRPATEHELETIKYKVDVTKF